MSYQAIPRPSSLTLTWITCITLKKYMAHQIPNRYMLLHHDPYAQDCHNKQGHFFCNSLQIKLLFAVLNVLKKRESYTLHITGRLKLEPVAQRCMLYWNRYAVWIESVLLQNNYLFIVHMRGSLGVFYLVFIYSSTCQREYEITCLLITLLTPYNIDAYYSSDTNGEKTWFIHSPCLLQTVTTVFISNCNLRFLKINT